MCDLICDVISCSVCWQASVAQCKNCHSLSAWRFLTHIQTQVKRMRMRKEVREDGGVVGVLEVLFWVSHTAIHVFSVCSKVLAGAGDGPTSRHSSNRQDPTHACRHPPPVALLNTPTATEPLDPPVGRCVYLDFKGVGRRQRQKAKAYNTCRAPQVTYRDFTGAGHVTGQASVGRRP